MWKVIVTVEEDAGRWDDIMQVVTALTDLDRRRFLDDWTRSQLRALRDRVQHLQHSHQRRQRRGLFDGIGKLAHSLFGVATDSEVKDLRSKIEENRKWQKTVSTWSSDLVVIINKTREEVALNRRVLNNITHYTLSVMSNVHLVFDLQRQVQQLEAIERRTADIIDDLEHGLLTELILPRKTLLTIVNNAIPLEWYYRWCAITPLWDKGYAFEVRLPVVSNRPFVGYELRPFAVWGPGNHAVELDIVHYAALDTVSGDVTEPRTCQGVDPTVCSHGTIRTGCAAAVITQQDVTDVCLLRRVEGERRPYHLAENELVVLFGETTLITEQCPSSDERQRVSLTRGTYRIQWRAGCRLQTPEFTITAAQMPVGHRTVNSWHIPSGAIDLVNYLQERTYPSILPPLLPMNLDSLPIPDKIYWYKDTFTVITWVTVSVLAVLVGVLLWWKSGLTCAHLPCLARSDQRESDVETSEPAYPSADQAEEDEGHSMPESPQPYIFVAD